MAIPKLKYVGAVATVVLSLMMLFPPYFGVYDQSGANRHTSLGWHPIWDPPSPAEAYRAIHGESHNAVPVMTAGEHSRVAEERLALTRVALNKVMLVFQFVVLVIATTVVTITLRWRQRRIASA
jgi:hypothetical protein